MGISAHATPVSGPIEDPIYAAWQADVAAVHAAGGLPLLLPPVYSADQARQVMERLDGFFLSGGVDISGKWYGEGNNPLIQDSDPQLDQSEIHLARAALQARKPLLAICRGVQLLNVLLGGDLIIDIPSQVPGALSHSPGKGQPPDASVHIIHLEPGSLIAAIMGQSDLTVNSFHHQALKRLGDGLVVTARAPDGIIEGVQLQDHPFCLGVQWHPEIHIGNQPGMEKIFQAFVQAGAFAFTCPPGRTPGRCGGRCQGECTN